jgi:methionine--tRNA ligase beta chain
LAAEKKPPIDVSFEEFQRIDVRVGRVIEAERVAGSKKLLRLVVDLGEIKRQCITGIGEQYESKDLNGRLIAVVTNLKPRKIMGFDSEVMVLAALDGPKISILGPDKEISAGSKVT